MNARNDNKATTAQILTRVDMISPLPERRLILGGEPVSANSHLAGFRNSHQKVAPASRRLRSHPPNCRGSNRTLQAQPSRQAGSEHTLGMTSPLPRRSRPLQLHRIDNSIHSRQSRTFRYFFSRERRLEDMTKARGIKAGSRSRYLEQPIAPGFAGRRMSRRTQSLRTCRTRSGQCTQLALDSFRKRRTQFANGRPIFLMSA